MPLQLIYMSCLNLKLLHSVKQFNKGTFIPPCETRELTPEILAKFRGSFKFFTEPNQQASLHRSEACGVCIFDAPPTAKNQLAAKHTTHSEAQPQRSATLPTARYTTHSEASYPQRSTLRHVKLPSRRFMVCLTMLAESQGVETSHQPKALQLRAFSRTR